jgi:hypothetical protein
VAKRFVEIGHGADNVSVQENSVQLRKEMIRLSQGDWFLKRFYERAHETDTEVATGLISYFSAHPRL